MAAKLGSVSKLLHPKAPKAPKMAKAHKARSAPKPKVKHGQHKTMMAEMKQTHKHSTIEHSMFTDHKGRPMHRVEHRSSMTFEGPGTSMSNMVTNRG